jgi:enamine deaminase RidA (YjgF/YER057c/UK114 family)
MSTSIGQPLARYAASKRAGDFLFLSGVIAVDPIRGKVVSGFADLPAAIRGEIGETGEFSVDVKQGPILAQSWFVLDRIRTLLAEAGGTMNDICRLVQYFRDLRDFPLYARVRRGFFPDAPPVSTVVEIAALLPTAEVLVEVEATAYLPAPRP